MYAMNFFSIGSDSNVSIGIRNPTISGVHAKLIYYQGIWTIEDNDSVYGTYIL